MVKDEPRDVALPNDVGTVVDVPFLPTATTYEAYDAVGLWLDSIVTQCDTWCGCCLTEDGSVGTDIHVALQCDDTAYIEDDDFLGRATDSLTEGTLAGVVQVCHMHNLTPAPTCRVTPVSFCSGKGGNLILCHRSK